MQKKNLFGGSCTKTKKFKTYLSKPFTILYHLSSLRLKNCWHFPAMHESHRKVESKPTSCILCIFFCNLSQITTLILLFWHTHVTQGRMKRMAWIFDLSLWKVWWLCCLCLSLLTYLSLSLSFSIWFLCCFYFWL